MALLCGSGRGSTPLHEERQGVFVSVLLPRTVMGDVHQAASRCVWGLGGSDGCSMGLASVATLGVRWEGGCTHTWWVELSTRVWGERGHHGLPQHERIFRVDASTEGAKQCMHVLGGVHIKLSSVGFYLTTSG